MKPTNPFASVDGVPRTLLRITRLVLAPRCPPRWISSIPVHVITLVIDLPTPTVLSPRHSPSLPRNNTTTDSPQWRRGPASKPMLCNACGTRYRRTNNLGPPTPMGRVGAAAVPKKRTPPASPSSLNPAKKARCAPSMGGLDRFTTAVRA